MADPMKLAILAGGDGWHVRDLRRAAHDLRLPCDTLDSRTLHSGSLDGNKRIVVRTMPGGSLEQVVFRMDLLHAAVAAGAVVLNPPRALETCVDKFLTDVRLRHASLPVPETITCQTAAEAIEAMTRLGGDVVVKPIFGSEGRGLVRLMDADTADRVFHALEAVRSVLYIQRFLQHPGWDVRAFVLGGRFLASMKRVHATDWRTNVARGGRAEPHALSIEEQELAVAAARATGAVYAGVDLLLADGRWHVLEVNAVPGWKALAAVTGIDVARRVLELARDAQP